MFQRTTLVIFGWWDQKSLAWESHPCLAWIKCAERFVDLGKQRPTVDEWWTQRVFYQEKQGPGLGRDADPGPGTFWQARVSKCSLQTSSLYVRLPACINRVLPCLHSSLSLMPTWDNLCWTHFRDIKGSAVPTAICNEQDFFTVCLIEGTFRLCVPKVRQISPEQ